MMIDTFNCLKKYRKCQNKYAQYRQEPIFYRTILASNLFLDNKLMTANKTTNLTQIGYIYMNKSKNEI